MKSRPNNMAIIPFNQDGLRIIDCVIGGYIPCLYMYEPVPHKTIEMLKAVRQKLAELLLPGGFPIGKSIRLEPIEIQALDLAIVGFASRLPLAVPQSEERDRFLAELNALHQHFSLLLHPTG